MTTPDQWQGPRLLVPVTVDAMVLTSIRQNEPWSWTPSQYIGMKFFAPIEPEPFNTLKPLKDDGSPLTGVVLHWAIPDALTHGSAPAGGKDPVAFPLVPNRWLVARTVQDPNDPTKRDITAWIVESDHTSVQDGTMQFSDPASKQFAAWTKLGRNTPYDSWQGETDTPRELFLTAVGAGSPTFAAFAVNVRDVFSFIDTMDGVDEGLLSYFVAGWYSDPPSDPLFGKKKFGDNGWQSVSDWQTLMSGFNWSVGDNDDLLAAISATQAWLTRQGIPFDSDVPRDLVPAQTLACGMIYDVLWQGPDGPPQRGAPDSIPQIAVGRTGAEALAALVEDQLGTDGHEAAALLEAFQYEMLSSFDNTGALAEIDDRIHSASFGGAPGGTKWRLVPAQDLSPDAGDPSQLAATLAPKVADLNEAQANLDALRRQLRSKQLSLFGSWWKLAQSKAVPPKPKPGPGVQAEFDAAKGQTKYLLTQIQAAQSDCDNKYKIVDDLRTTSLTLVADAITAFEQANDPVVLVTGARRGYKHGEDGRFTSDGQLLCRFSGQTITGIAVQPTDTPTDVTASNVTIAALAQRQVPREVIDLCVETFFLDTNAAPVIATQALKALGKPTDKASVDALAQIVAKQQTLVWNADVHAPLDRQTVAQMSGLIGVPPSKVGVALYSPPWSPLYLDWQVMWHPSYHSAADVLKPWVLDGADYRWNGSNPPPTPISLVATGRTLLTPQTTDALQSRMEQFLQNVSTDDPNFGEQARLLGEVVKAVGEWDLLSQTLSGFSDWLVMRHGDQHPVPVDADLVSLIGDMTHLVPSAGTNAAYFFPIRAGHFTIQALHIVDDFGQVFDPIGARGQTGASFAPIRSRTLITAGDQQRVQLAPRLTQTSRLNLTLRSAANDSLTDPSDPTTTPVCGWVLPNHLDHALSVYDASGALCGEIMLAQTAAGLRALWSAVPGSAAQLGAPPAIPNPHLLAFIQAILARPDSGNALRDLLDVIDSTLWTVDPLGGRGANSTLSLLIGRPLAVVRASLGLELEMDPLVNQAWSKANANDSGGVLTIPFPVRLGNLALADDGLLAFFTNDDYSAISALRDPDASTPSGYVVQRDIPLTLNGNEAAVTMIVDPRGSVHASSGILPVLSLVLPSSYVDPALAAMDVTFRTGPLLADPATIRMPTPGAGKGAWSWIQRTGVTVWEEDGQLLKSDGIPRFPDTPPVMREGWLKLTAAAKQT